MSDAFVQWRADVHCPVTMDHVYAGQSLKLLILEGVLSYSDSLIHMLTLNSSWQKAELFTVNTLPLSWHRQAVAAQTPSILPHSRLLTSPTISILYLLSNVFYDVLLIYIAWGFKLKRLNGRHVYLAALSREWEQTDATIWCLCPDCIVNNATIVANELKDFFSNVIKTQTSRFFESNLYSWWH